jgi:hypothetical protein
MTCLEIKKGNFYSMEAMESLAKDETLPDVKCVVTGRDFHGGRLGNP